MTISNTAEKKQSLERLELSNKPTIIITDRLKKQIDFLHQKVGNNEWSGELITREEGNINDLDGWKIYAEDIFLADIGTGAYTAYEVDKGGFKAVDVIELYDTYPGLLEGTYKSQHIHSHHLMQTFFSGTDWSQLEDRGILCNYFLMLIVNHAGKYCSKVAFKAKRANEGSTVLSFANNNDGFSPLTLKGNDEKDVLVVMDCKIEHEESTTAIPLSLDIKQIFGNLITEDYTTGEQIKELIAKAQELLKTRVETSFEERYEKVKKAIEEEKSKSKIVTHSNPGKQLPFDKGWTKERGFGRDYNNGYDDWAGGDDWGPYGSTRGFNNGEKKGKKKKNVMDMTDAEWKKYQEEDSEIPKFEKKHMYALVNSVFSKNTITHDFTAPIAKIMAENQKLGTNIEMFNWLEEFFKDLRDNFDIMFSYIQVDDYDYQEMLDIMGEYLGTYKYNRLVNEIIETIAYEILKYDA